LAVIAERIENRATADPLVSMGCEQGQGYFFGRSMPAQALESQFLIAGEPAVQAGVRKSSLSNDFYEAYP
jgi:EAL domain-containing protein (putative c-di-GMP-specific phosphodiesterase class I)